MCNNFFVTQRDTENTQRDAEFFNNILIDKNYSAELLGPFITSSPIQRILENYEIVSKANPMLYVVSTFREGMLGVSDVSISFSLGMCGNSV